ncbi:MAG: glycosyltransferase [Candidatus Micrarchaeaceae archaeon]
MGEARYSDITVIIPTLNEEKNVRKIVPILCGMYKGIHIIFADDGSTDGTKEAARALSKRYANVELLDRTHAAVHGLTVSVIDAALHANTEKIIVMDADLQHPPRMVGKISAGLNHYDIVVGVRISVRSWGFHRRVMSKGMAFIAYAVLKMRRRYVCNDIMSGFFGIKANVFKNIIRKNRGLFVPTGYKVLLDTLRLAGPGLLIGEVKYSTFHKRYSGSSKFKPKIMLDTLKSTFR